MITDTSQSLDLAGRHSIVAYDLRTVICIPLRKPQVQTTRDAQAAAENTAEVMGALYVDSRFASRDISSVSNDILRAIATEAASLIENARLVQAEEARRRYQQELSIAAGIQQRLMAVTIPEVPFAALRGEIFLVKKSAAISSTRSTPTRAWPWCWRTSAAKEFPPRCWLPRCKG